MKTQNISKYLQSSSSAEEGSLPSGAFVAYIGKKVTVSLTLTAVLGIAMGLLLSILGQDFVAGCAFGIVGLLSALFLPTFLSYRCYVDSDVLTESYYILFFRKKREVLWRDIQFKATRTAADGSVLSLRFYNRNRKKLLSFDSSIVGFSRIVRMAKRKSIPKK